MNNLTAISPIDGRYFEDTQELSQYFSEYALFKTRIEIEIKYLTFLEKEKIAPKIRNRLQLEDIYKYFSLKDAEKVKYLEKETKHDVKAVEIFIGSKLKNMNNEKLIPFIHFALTSYDINDTAYRLMIKRALSEILIPQLVNLTNILWGLSKKYSDLVILGRTHGQPAVPTTLGKEFVVFASRLDRQLRLLKSIKYYSKLSGAVGNWNAHTLAYPKMNWFNLSNNFLKSLGLENIKISTQITPADDIVQLFQTFILINLILLDLDRDMWRYISDNWIIKKTEGSEVGSSTMPQKVNPINFENSEGNLELANSLFTVFTRELPVSRLQRDLSDSTQLRNIGVAFAHGLIAYKNTIKGLLKIEINKAKIKIDLNENWNILAEGLQTILRKEGKQEAFNNVVSLMKGKIINQKEWQKIIKELDISTKEKNLLIKLTPETYIGMAKKLSSK